MKKKILVALSVLIASMCFVSCNKKTRVTTLDTPTNLVIENQYISFDEVANASYYMINYDGNTITIKPSGTGEIIFNASKIFDEAKTYEIKVKAIGTGSFADSAYTKTKEYTRHQIFGTPVVKLNGQVLTWSAIEDAKHYTIKVTYPNGTQGFYTYSNNSFDIKPLLSGVGQYVFQVKVGQEADNNDYSPRITYLYQKQLEKPSNLTLSFNSTENEVYLYFVADENTYSYTINVNGVDYSLQEAYIDTYLKKENYNNLNKVKLFAFLQSQNVDIDNIGSLAVSVVSKSSINDYYITSQKSSKAYLDIKTMLATPTATVAKTGENYTLSWGKVDNATGYVVYKNFEYFATLDANTTSIVLTKSQYESNVYHIQVDGVGKHLKSLLSNSISSNSLLSQPNLQFASTKLIFGEQNVAKYALEIFNDQFYQFNIIDGDILEFDLSNFAFGKYTARLMYIDAEDKVSNYKTININYTQKLKQPNNVVVGNSYSRYVVNFDKVDGAVGYAIELNNNDLGKIYTTNTIDLTEYILVAGKYNLKIKAIAPFNSNITDSDWVDVGSIQHAVKLAKPQISVVNDGEKYILKFDKVENAEKYEILINYISIYEDGVEWTENGVDISSYFTSAQIYTVMVKAMASTTNITYVNSDYNTISVPKYVQLHTINGDKISIVKQDGKYFINFETQTHAANYDLRFVNTTTGAEELVNINSVPYDITNFVKNKGNYSIYVRAKASEGTNYLYLSSAESGNPYLLEKDKETLAVVTGITADEKQAGEQGKDFYLKWTAVSNADSYYVNIYYQALNNTKGDLVLLQEVNTTTNKLNLADYLKREGNYKFKIKAVSKGDFESSGVTDFSYKYIMTVDNDFARNTVFMNGVNYSHLISSYEQLKNVMWYYYLFNLDEFYDDVNDLNYKFKIMLKTSIETLESQCKQENPSFEIITEDNGEPLSEMIRLHRIAAVALSSYKEGMLLKNNNFYTPNLISEDTGKYYTYNFEAGLDADKLATINKEDYRTSGLSQGKRFEQKSNELPLVEQRRENYSFSIDAKEKVDVTTTEQLFMVVQYGKAPNFVGSCEVAQTVYNNCRSTLNSIISNNMTYYEKVVAIYNWLIANVEYNEVFAQLMQTNTKLSDTIKLDSNILMGNCKYNYLEGVFYDVSDRSATADGFAKAFVLMCRMEGIEAIKVNGASGSYGHFWNKVNLQTPNTEEKAWYAVDIAYGFRTLAIDTVDYIVPTHKYFLVQDSYLINEGLRELYSPNNVGAITDFNYLAYTSWSFKKYMYATESGTTFKKLFEGIGTLKYLSSQEETVEDYIKNIMKYMVATCQENENNLTTTTIVNMYTLEVDLSNYQLSLDNIVTSIIGDYYILLCNEFKCSFHIYAESYTSNNMRKIIIAIRP